MRIRSKLIIATLLSSALVCSAQAKPYKHQPLANPCKSDFEISVSVTAVDGIDTWPVGVKLSYKAGAARGIASRVQTDDTANFDAAQCEAWQKRNWAELNQVLFEAKNPERHGLECVNMAEINTRVGSKSQHAQICLGSAAEDNAALGFKRFFENTDGMVR